MIQQSNSLACPTCNDSLLSTADAGRFKCRGCGTEVILKGGRPETASDRVAAELAIRRLNDELTQLIMQRDSIAYQYHSHQATGGAAALVVGVLALVTCWMISAYLFINGSPIAGRVWLVVGIAAAVVLILAIRKSSDRKGDRLAASLEKDLRLCDRHIDRVKQQIIKNQIIVNS